MKITKKFGLVIMVVLLPITAMVHANGYQTSAATQGVTGLGATGDVTTPLHAVLSINQLPPIGKQATVTCRVTTDQPAPGTTIKIELPANARSVNGDLEWEGDLAAEQSISATVVFDSGGDTTVLCRTLRQIDAKNSWGDLAALYLSIGQTATKKGFASVPPAKQIHKAGMKHAGDGMLIPDDQARSVPRPKDKQVEAPSELKANPPRDQAAPKAPAQQSPPQSLQSPGDITITGNFAYYDRNDNYVGALEFLVELVRGDNYGHLAWCYTDLDGTYSCGPATNPGDAGVRTILYSWVSYNPNGDILAVVNPDWGTTNATGNAFRAQTGVVVFPDGSHDIGAWFVVNNDSYERAYWTQRDINETWRYILFNGGGGTAGPTTVLWKLSSTDGTYYSPGGNVHLMGVDPLAPLGVPAKHEYGHNIMYNIYGNYMPPNPNCNPHSIPKALSAGCGWTEGWTEFLTSVVNNEPAYYWASGSRLDLENPTWGTPGWDNGDWPEGRIAGALWDIFDANNDGYDTYSDGTFVNLWDVSYNENDNVMSDFWFHWLARGHSNEGPIMDLYQNTIDYR